jgi:hypothetical protein
MCPSAADTCTSAGSRRSAIVWARTGRDRELDETRATWVERTFSLNFGYSWSPITSNDAG